MPEKVPAELVINRGSSGTTFELRFRTRLHGPCVRCLKDAVVDLPVYAREYQATNPGDAEELRTQYLTENRLDLSAWARDAVALELPDQILCREDCAGLCPVCGEDLNARIPMSTSSTAIHAGLRSMGSKRNSRPRRSSSAPPAPGSVGHA